LIDKDLAVENIQRQNWQETQFIEIRVARNPENYKLIILSEISEKVNANKKIEDQLAELKKVNNDLDNFVYTASHDLKAPISNIEGLMNALTKSFSEETRSKAQVKKIVDMIFLSIGRFKTTIGDLSDITKIEKTFQEDQQLLDLDDILTDVKVSIGKYIDEHKAKIISDCNQTKIFFSKKNLKSILYNLISNAIKYKDLKRTPVIHIYCREEEEYLVLIVEDNGLGIPADRIPLIFEMFKRLHSHVDGSGIGLFIVKRIVENAQGKIEVESELGKGSAFKIYFKKDM